MRQIAVSYGSNSVPAMGGSADPSRRVAVGGATPAIGSGVNLPSENPVESVGIQKVSCAGITKRGTDCGAPVVRGTEWCAGHLRSVNKDD